MSEINTEKPKKQNFYISLFKDSKIIDIEHYGVGEDDAPEITVKHAIFSLNGPEFMANDSNMEHPLHLLQPYHLLSIVKRRKK